MLLTVLPEPSRDLGLLHLPLVVCRSSWFGCAAAALLLVGLRTR